MIRKLTGGYFRGFPLAVLRMAQSAIPLHSHDFAELVVILGGRGVHFTEDDAYEIAAGDVFVLAGPRGHGYRDTDDLRLANILFHPEELRLPMAELRKMPGYHALFRLEPDYRKRHKFRSRLRLSLPDLTRAEGMIEAMERELNGREAGFEFLATAELMRLLGFLARRYTRRPDAAAQPLLRLGEVFSRLEQRFDETVTLEELATLAHMSPSGLLRAFRRATGFAPIEYLIRLRVRKAAERLRAGEGTVKEIAFECGFEDSNYFARQFRRVMGASPTVFRRGGDAGGDAR